MKMTVGAVVWDICKLAQGHVRHCEGQLCPPVQDRWVLASWSKSLEHSVTDLGI